MAQSCLNCLKYTMCAVNFLFWLCGTAVLGFGVYLMTSFQFSSLIPSLPSFSIASCLVITGTIISCIAFLGFLGALKENRCLLISFFILLFILMMAELAAACVLLVNEKQVGHFIENDLRKSLELSKNVHSIGNETKEDDWDLLQKTLRCCGVTNYTDWKNITRRSCCDGDCKDNKLWEKGCFDLLREFFEEHFLTTGAAVIAICVVEVLGMCFAMTLFCHISRSGLGYK